VTGKAEEQIPNPQSQSMSKSQIPMKPECPNPKRGLHRIGIWGLDIDWDLGFGIWHPLVLGISIFHKRALRKIVYSPNPFP